MVEIYVGNLHVCLIVFTTTRQIYKSWSLHVSNFANTGACITQNQKDWRSRKLNHKQSYPIGTGRPATTFGFSNLLCSKNSSQCCCYGLSSFRLTEVILTHSKTLETCEISLLFYTTDYNKLCHKDGHAIFLLLQYSNEVLAIRLLPLHFASNVPMNEKEAISI